MPVLAKVAGELYSDLVHKGFQIGRAIDCSQCNCSYRVFYEPNLFPTSIEQASLAAPLFEHAVANSHPEHPNRIHV
jgi:hypothetical protein